MNLLTTPWEKRTHHMRNKFESQQYGKLTLTTTSILLDSLSLSSLSIHTYNNGSSLWFWLSYKNLYYDYIISWSKFKASPPNTYLALT